MPLKTESRNVKTPEPGKPMIPPVRPESPPPGVPKKRGFRWSILVYVAIVAGVAFAVIRQSGQVPEVSVASASVVDLATSFTAEAYVRGKDYQLSPETPGKVAELYARENAQVTKGQLLLRVDDSEVQAQLRQAEATQRAAASAESQARVHLRTASEQANSRVAAARSNLRQAQARLAQVTKGARGQEIGQAEHRVEGLKAALDDADKAYQRAQFLFGEGAIPRMNLDSAEARFKAAKAAYDEAEAALALVREGSRPEEVQAAQASVDAARADLSSAVSGLGDIPSLREAVTAAQAQWAGAAAAADQIKANLPKTELRAPVAGVVSKIFLEAGTMASPAVPAITLSTRQDLRIEAEVSTEDAAKVAAGMKVVVTSPAYPGRTFTATVQAMSPVGELKPDAAIRTRIVRARVMLDRDWELFRPGMEVDVEGGGLVKRALAVPSDAISLDGARCFVYVLSANGIVASRDVRIGRSNVDFTEILDGLREGDVVVTRGKEGLKSGDRVEVKK